MWTLLNTFRRSIGYARKMAQKWLVRSVLITLITWFGGPTPGAAQDTGSATASPTIVYVSNGGGGITEVNTANNSIIATAPFPNSSGQVAGFFRLRGNPARHGFIATPTGNEQDQPIVPRPEPHTAPLRNFTERGRTAL